MILIVSILTALEVNVLIHTLFFKFSYFLVRILTLIWRWEPSQSCKQKKYKTYSYQQLVPSAEDPDDSGLLVDDASVVTGELSELSVSMVDGRKLGLFLLVWLLRLLVNDGANVRDVVTLLVVKSSAHPYNNNF